MKNTISYLKNNAQRLVTLVCVTVAPVVATTVITGCAGDRYHESTGESIDDTAITARVKSALSSDPTFKYSDVHVTTFKGSVQLSGFVVSPDARNHATDLAKNAEGVRNVTNSIDVR